MRNPWGADGALVFHPADYPVRIWAAQLAPSGVLWDEADIVRIDDRRVYIRYHGDAAHLDRRRLALDWAMWRGVYFASSRSGNLARHLDGRWFEKYGRWASAGSPPPAKQMPLADAIQLFSLPANYTRDDIIAAFRRLAKKAHPDAGGSADLFRRAIEARDRVLVSLGMQEAAPKMPEFAPKGTRTRYTTVRSHSSSQNRLGHQRRLAFG